MSVRFSAALFVLVLVSTWPRVTRAHYNLEGDFFALGPSIGTASFAGERALHVGAELSAGYVHLVRDAGWGRVTYGGWLDYQHAYAPLRQERIGIGAQIIYGPVPLVGVELGMLAVRVDHAWFSGFRSRAFVTFGYVSFAAGGGWVRELGRFNEFTALLKLPFSCSIDGAVPICR